MDETTTGDKTKKYVLVIDADAVDRFTTCMLLQRFGYYIFTAGTPEEAMDFMSVSRPSAIVADASKSVADILSGIRKDARFSRIPIILLSKSDKELEHHRSRGGKIAAYLRKPIHVEEFYRVLQTIIEKGSRRNIRIPTKLTAALEDEFSATGGIVSDLSEDGMFFQSPDPRPQNAHIPISVQIMGRTILLEAVVLYCSAVEEGSLRKPGMGMKFEKISPVDRDLIKAFILDQVREGMSRQRYYNC
jgi:CheY-like chemotaxis protein